MNESLALFENEFLFPYYYERFEDVLTDSLSEEMLKDYIFIKTLLLEFEEVEDE